MGPSVIYYTCMANARNQTIDRTFLSLDQAEERGFIHRDYIAHCLRWTHVVKRLYERKSYENARILDVGCGRELPFAKLLHSSRLIPQQYFGVDVGPIEDSACAKFEGTKFPLKVWEKTNLLELAVDDFITHPAESAAPGPLANIVVCFECFEHVEPKMLLEMLAKMKELTSEDARFFFSTPCWNRTDCAANHVNEMTYEALGAVLEAAGFKIEHTHGTFASIRDYQDILTPEQQRLFNGLREYYDSNFLSCIFAPLIPHRSRNVLWECSKELHNPPVVVKFEPLSECKKPWGSSALWEDMGGAK